MANTPNLYEILDLVEKQHDAILTPEQLRQAYKQALLHHHPDKHGHIKGTQHTPTVDDISEAYRVLSDPTSRSEYDRKLRLQDADRRGDATRHTGMETVDLEELDFIEKSGTWIRDCRCGSKPAYIITEPELEKNADFGELITGCKGCSLWLKVLFTVEE